ncbi:MAG: Rieske (2Fe-2S) protein [Vicinamibacterales bacterium]
MPFAFLFGAAAFNLFGWVPVAAADELERGQMKLLRVNGKRIALARTPDGYVAFDDRCTQVERNVGKLVL